MGSFTAVIGGRSKIEIMPTDLDMMGFSNNVTCWAVDWASFVAMNSI